MRPDNMREAEAETKGFETKPSSRQRLRSRPQVRGQGQKVMDYTADVNGTYIL